LKVLEVNNGKHHSDTEVQNGGTSARDQG